MDKKTKLELLSNSEAKTEAIGRAIGAAVLAGDVIGLRGELGAGKTRLVKGIALGLDVTEYEKVKSPTFVIVREHPGRLRLFHVDAYRLSGAAELWGLGWEEMLNQGGLTVVEWAERVAEALPADRLNVELEIAGANTRRVRMSWGGTESKDLLGRIRKRWSDK
ncbi:MAG: tRNA (adenosine(37)-N6)-threonylcarbamoyltransferase complex ATPase subunit type 1 TsaE [Actinobacteria bacterium]|nr:tRNA (adenosine(37)-N6)-threonylcarbamoyltransferase complex ATPase subunit type 1 TsaE [Actinomycetota bacterium]